MSQSYLSLQALNLKTISFGSNHMLTASETTIVEGIAQMITTSNEPAVRCAIMQPYLFPYLGYFQLIAAVDTFVFFDDVNYIKKGWINRNNVLLNGKAHLFTLPVSNPSQNRHINEHFLVGGDHGKRQLLSLIEHAYAKAPHYREMFPVIESIIMSQSECLSEYLAHGITQISQLLDLNTTFTSSSTFAEAAQLKAQDKIIDIAHRINAQTYINPIGGIELYDVPSFAVQKLKLQFIKMSSTVNYRQFDAQFVPSLSIIDVLMFNSRPAIKNLLTEYELV
jgi:hypothetical protein